MHCVCLCVCVVYPSIVQIIVRIHTCLSKLILFLGRLLTVVLSVLTSEGFVPSPEGTGEKRLYNCMQNRTKVGNSLLLYNTHCSRTLSKK